MMFCLVCIHCMCIVVWVILWETHMNAIDSCLSSKPGFECEWLESEKVARCEQSDE